MQKQLSTDDVLKMPLEELDVVLSTEDGQRQLMRLIEAEVTAESSPVTDRIDQMLDLAHEVSSPKERAHTEELAKRCQENYERLRKQTGKQ